MQAGMTHPERLVVGHPFKEVMAMAKQIKADLIVLGGGAAVEAAAERFGLAMREQRLDAPEERAALGRMLLGPLRTELVGSSRWLIARYPHWRPCGSCP